MTHNIETMKNHLRDNKNVYIAATVGVVVGASVAVLAVKYNNVKVTQTAAQKALVNWKTTIHQEQITYIELPARGHRGFTILNEKTGEVYGSIKKTADTIGCSPKTLRDHLKGLIDNIDGNTYKNLGENLTEQVKVAV